MKIQRFEEIKAWQEARGLVKDIYQSIRFSEKFREDHRFRDQITSAAVSIMSNIAEGFSRRSSKELYAKTDEIARILSGFITYLLNELK